MAVYVPIDSEKLAALRDRAARADEMLDLARRERAEFSAYQDRVRRDKEEAARYRGEPLARDLIPALDAFESSLATISSKEVAEGVRLVEREILRALARHDVTEIEAAGRPFDPRLHQAVEVARGEGHPPHTVLAVLKRGFALHDRVLRPAMVRVSAPA
jgi:molecular chaperone GrpE